MRRTATAILTILMLVLTSCSAGEISGDGEMLGTVSGTVTDQEDKPLEHISITVIIDEVPESLTFYTSSEGKFRFDLPMESKDGQSKFRIVIKDIDGEENGGLFQEKTDDITLFEEDYSEFPITIEIPPYRLIRATASENIPQS